MDPDNIIPSNKQPFRRVTRSQSVSGAVPKKKQPAVEVKNAKPVCFTSEQIECVRCQILDSELKAVCTACTDHIHMTCAEKISQEEVLNGKWCCKNCSIDLTFDAVNTALQKLQSVNNLNQNSSLMTSKNSDSKCLSNSSDCETVIAPSGKALNEKSRITIESTHVKIPSKPSSRISSVASNKSRISSSEQLKLLDDELKLRQRHFEQLRIEEERRSNRIREENEEELRLLAQRRAILEEAVSESRSQKSSVGEKNRNLEKWIAEQSQSRVRFSDKPNNDREIYQSRDGKDLPYFRPSAEQVGRVPTNTEHFRSQLPPVQHHSQAQSDKFDQTLPWLKPHTSEREFLENTMVGNTAAVKQLNLNQSQLQARFVIPKELPTFSGDPKHWPYFITAYVDTTEQCGFTDRENLARLSKCLKGDALEAVRSDLLLPSSLPTALSTLRMLYGRPDLIFNAAVEQVKQTPAIKMDRLETLITYSMRVKSLCDTIKSASMPQYLQNPSLLMELVKKLPTTLRLEWSRFRHQVEMEDPNTDLDTFNQWLRSNAEIASAVTDLPAGCLVASSSNSKREQNTKEAFHAVHEEKNQMSKSKVTDLYCVLCKSKGHSIAKCRNFVKLTNVNRWTQIKKLNLCVCCLGKHWLRECSRRKLCGIGNCNQPHNPLLHTNAEDKAKSRDQNTQGTESTPIASSNLQVNVHHRTEENVYYQVVPVTLYGKNGHKIETHAFLDGGSTVTLLEDSVARELDLDGVPARLRLKWTNDIVREEKHSRKVSVQVSGQDGKMYWLQNVRTAGDLSLPVQSLEKDNLRRYEHLKTIPITTYEKVQPQLLIGLDHYQLMVPQEIKEGDWHDPVAIRTRIGWTLQGGAGKSKSWNSAVNMHTLQDNSLHDLVTEFFSLESLGVTPPNLPVESLEDTRAKLILKNTVRKVDEGRYEAGLLWRNDNDTLPNSRGMALHRLQCFEKKLKKVPSLAEAVNTQFRDYIADGYLEKLTSNEAKIHSPRTWYLPIFAVTNINKPGKTRLVWDAAATVDGKSLNTYLLSGPDLLANLVSILFKFRERRYGITGDIKQMFHQVKIREEDQNSQRCLWRFSPQDEPETYRMTVMTFGATCSPATSQYVKNMNAEAYKSVHPRAVEAIQERHYVDDFIDSFDSIAECVEVTKNVIKIHKAGGFEIRNFSASTPEILTSLAQDPEITEKVLADPSDGTKVLGMHWNTKDDTLRFRINVERMGQDLLEQNKIPTKRTVLRILMTIYDPLGLIAFFIVHGKLIVKEVWRTGIDWDEEIQPTQMHKWKDWIQAMKVIETVRVPRSYFENRESAANYELHTFVDASKDAVAAVAYLVQNNCDGTRNVTFISAKTKGTPNKVTSIPRLELQAAVLGARLANTIEGRHTIPLKQRFFHSDSLNVLYWIRSPRKFAPFVEFRIGEILETTKNNEWRWVPTDVNIADEATKWKFSKKRCIPPRWYSGPDFLSLPSHEWPKESKDAHVLPDEELEVRCLLTTFFMKEGNLTPEFERFSSLNRLVRVQAYVLRIIHRNNLPKRLPVTADELEESLRYLIRSVQITSFAKDLAVLKRDGKVEKNSVLREYSPFLDAQSILRMRSRLKEAEYLTFEQVCPIILPRKCYFTDLLIAHYHDKYYHRNDGTVLNELQQLYVIPRLRSQLKSVRSKCIKCKIRDAKPEVPEMADLPRCRLAAKMKPFTFTGVDYFGPFTVKHGRRLEKKWGAIFTCLTTRAVHIELVSSLSADAFILVLRSFIGRRGQPNEIFSDNGTNFRGAENELRKIVQEHILNAVSEKFANIKWHFNPPAAPHMGGAWERLIRSIKIGLKFALPERSPTEDLLRCCLVEIEAMINSRPLTYVQLEDNSLEALTPNHFLLGSSGGIKPIAKFSDDVHIFRTEWKKQQQITQIFWSRWIQEYLPVIAKRTKWYDPVEQIMTGDVVALGTADMPHSWQIGRVTEVTFSKDGKVRRAEIQTATGILQRPASKIAVLLRAKEELKSPHEFSTGGSVKNIK